VEVEATPLVDPRHVPARMSQRCSMADW
jgi:hypothetical protein